MEDENLTAAELIRRLLTILSDEVERNPRLANKVMAALPKSIARVQPAKPFGGNLQPEFHAVNVLRAHGENMLRGKLTQVNNKERLRAIAKASNLTLAPSAYKTRASVAELVEVIVTAAVDYDKQRTAAIDAER